MSRVRSTTFAALSAGLQWLERERHKTCFAQGTGLSCARRAQRAPRLLQAGCGGARQVFIGNAPDAF